MSDTRKTQRRRYRGRVDYVLSCALCQTPVSLGRDRYIELASHDRKPVCRRCVACGSRRVDWAPFDEEMDSHDPYH